jgi:replicative DNA helicase
LDLDKAFVSSLVFGGPVALRRMKEKGASPEFVAGEGRKALDFVLDYYGKYGSVPDASVVEGRTGIHLDPAPAPAEFFIDEILNRKLHARLQKAVLRVTGLLEDTKPVEAYRAYEEELREIRQEQAVPSKVVSLPSMAPEVLALYEKIKAGETGVLTPWPTINDLTLGFWPQDLVLFVARLGIGKTWTLILLMQHAWAVKKKRVLFGTTEMSVLKIASRWLSRHLNLSYRDLRKGTLGVFAEKRLVESVAEVQGMEGLYSVGGNFDFRIESFEAAIDECAPDLAILDGAYLLKMPGKDRFERASEVFNELKRVAIRKNLPIVVSMQFNRDVKANKAKTVKTENIAMTDVAGWNGDMIFALDQTDEQKRDKRMRISPLKFREGENGEPFEINWRIDEGNFSEIPKPGSQSMMDPVLAMAGQSPSVAAADDFDTGTPPAAGDGKTPPKDPNQEDVPF